MKTIETGTLVTVIAVSAALLGGCNRNGPVQVCADGSGRRQPDVNCGSRSNTYGANGGWIYLNHGNAPRVGDRIRGGSYGPAPGVRYGSATEGMSRGGFGGTGERGGFIGG